MIIPDQTFYEGMVEPLYRGLYAGFSESLFTYRKGVIPGYQGHAIYKRTRAANLSNLMAQYILTHPEEFLPATPMEDHERVWLSLDNHVKLRFKKVDRYMRSANYPTQMALEVDSNRNDEQLLLPGFSAAVNLKCGYFLDPQSDKFDLFLICPRERGSNHWVSLIPPQDDIEHRIVGDMPTVPTIDLKEDIRQIRSKKSK